MAKIVFKELTSNQNVLFPVSLSEKIAPNHPVRVVNSVVDALDIGCLLRAYKGGGTSSYHPRMMLKVLFYAYLNNIYSCRKIEKALQENIYFMWLSGNSTPDFRTINDFRGKRLKEHIKSLFSAIVLLLQESGYVSLDVQYIDGTKVESASLKSMPSTPFAVVTKGTFDNTASNIFIRIPLPIRIGTTATLPFKKEPRSST